MLTRGGLAAHPAARKQQQKTILSVRDYLDIMKDYPGYKLIIVGGSHKPYFYKKSRVYSNCLQRGLAKAGINVEMQLDNRDADKDFFYMNYAKKYIMSTGGFSRYIGEMVERHGGKVLNTFVQDKSLH